MTVAVIDSGLEMSEDLSGGRADRFFDFTVDGRRAHPYDDYGHGTHVASLISGEGKKSESGSEPLREGQAGPPQARTVPGDRSEGAHRQPASARC